MLRTQFSASPSADHRRFKASLSLVIPVLPAMPSVVWFEPRQSYRRELGSAASGSVPCLSAFGRHLRVESRPARSTSQTVGPADRGTLRALGLRSTLPPVQSPGKGLPPRCPARRRAARDRGIAYGSVVWENVELAVASHNAPR